MATMIDAPTLKALLESESLHAVVDVRDWGEFTLEQIPGSRTLPRGYIEKYLPVLVPRKDIQIVFSCDTGQRSARTARTAEALGYTNVASLTGGLKSWKACEYDTVHGWSLRGKEYGEQLQVEEEIPEFTAEELHERLTRGEPLYILDTRTEPEFLATHLPGAYSTPGGELAQLVTDIAQDRSVPIVTNCAGRTRSLLGAHVLRRMGFPRVYALKGGTGAWRIAGYGSELESGPGAVTPTHSSTSVAACAHFAERIAVEDKISFLTSQELQTRQQQGELLYLLDVRRLEEYRAGHLPGAHFCPGTQTALLVDSYVGVKNATVVTVCDTQARAILAASLLKGMGYPRVFVLDGGIQAWQSQGFPLEVGEPYDIDYGQPPWLSRLMLGLPAGVQPRERPIAGLDEAKTQTSFLAPQTLQEKIVAGEQLALLDLRSVGDFATAHIPSARWLSRGRLDLEIAQAVPDKNIQVVLYCRKGQESPLSTATLAQLGYRQVSVLEGGFDAWKTAGLPIAQGLGPQAEFEALAIAEVGLLGSGPYGYNNDRMAKYLQDEEELGKKYRRKRATT